MAEGKGWFRLRWRYIATGDVQETEYRYDGLYDQQGYTRTGWMNRCIAAGKAEGYEYLGLVKEWD